VLVAHRIKEDQPIPNSRVLTGKCTSPFCNQNGSLIVDFSICEGSTDGSLASLTIVEEEPFKRLGLLQGQLMRNIQHMAALNPKVFR
jgi:cleavage and polyadenylation specificity factor subunit 1